MSFRSAGQSERTAANRVAQIVTFLRAHGIKDVSIRPRYTKKKVMPYSEAELAALFAAATHEEKFLFSFLLMTGARKQEAMYATYQDIDFENRLFIVREKLDLGYRPKRRGTSCADSG